MSARRALWGLLVSILMVGVIPAQETVGTSAVLRDGLVFRNGKFLPGPYVLQSVETEQAVKVVVAGVTLDRFSVAGPIDVAPADPTIPPLEYEIPEGLETLKGSGYPSYLHRLLKYHTSLVGAEEALALVEKHASNCPLVKRLESEENGLLLFDGTGDPYYVSAGSDLVPPGRTRAEALSLADRTLQSYQALLSRGGAILHFHGADVFLPRARVVDVWIPSLEILDDPTLTREDKRRRLEELWKNDALVEEMLVGYRPVPELWGALQAYDAEWR